MANSVSKINVLVGANTTQLTAGMQQAAGAVKGFSASAGSAQMAMSQMAFAVDDAVTVFGTSGLAGSLRAAGNNLTMMASTLFGIKGLMISVAAVGAAQLAMTFFKMGTGAKKASDEIDKLADAQKRMRDVRFEGAGNRMDMFFQAGRQSLPDAIKSLNDVRHSFMKSEYIMSRLQEDRATVANRFIPGELEGFDEVASHFKAIRDKELADLDERIAKESDILKILNGQELTMTEIVRQKRAAVAPGVPGDRFGFFSGKPGAQGIKGQLKLDALRQGGDPFRFFGSLPGANQFGSSGAVSTINQAMTGPKNVENAQLQELRNISRATGDAARALGGKLLVSEVVGL